MGVTGGSTGNQSFKEGHFSKSMAMETYRGQYGPFSSCYMVLTVHDRRFPSSEAHELGGPPRARTPHPPPPH